MEGILIEIENSTNMFKTEPERKPLNELSVNKKRRPSDLADEPTLTPPRSTIRKANTPNDKTINVHPLSPELSSPIQQSKAKKQKIISSSNDGSNSRNPSLITTRSTNSNTLEELIESLSDTSKASTLQDPNKKPPYSYAMLIGLAILQSSQARLTLSQIYHWISAHFPYYRPQDAGWRNSIRHNLSLNEAFIKGGKSSDGKGHFWEVKSGFEGKFFKGNTQASAEIRRRLRTVSVVDAPTDLSSDYVDEAKAKSTHRKAQVNHGETLNKDSWKLPTDSYDNFRRKYRNPDTSEIDYDSDLDDNPSPLLDVASSPQAQSPTPFELNFGDLDDKANDKDAFIDDDDHAFHSDPMSQHRDGNDGYNAPSLKRSNTAIGLQRVEWTQEHNGFIADGASLMSSPRDFKKYTCSFNTNFDTTSPVPKRNASGPLLESLQSPSTKDKPKNHSNDLLSTPKVRQASHGEERTPFVTATPRDDVGSSVLKWQTPSFFFDDFYASPLVLKTFETPIISIDDCMDEDGNGKRADLKSPRKLNVSSTNRGNGVALSRAHKFFESSRFSSSSLFGVDVCSVWKRAVESCGDLSRQSPMKDKKLGVPFQGTKTMGNKDSVGEKGTNTGETSES